MFRHLRIMFFNMTIGILLLEMNDWKSNVAVIRKPWEWQKKVYQNLELHLDAAIDKVDNLAKDVELQRMEKKWDELYEQIHQESETASIQSQPVALVSEKEYEYGADAFEIYMKENKGKIKPEMKEVAVQKNEKARQKISMAI